MEKSKKKDHLKFNIKKVQLIIVFSLLTFFLIKLAITVKAQQGQTLTYYTGCLQNTRGTLDEIATGTNPLNPCRTGESQITWSNGDILSVTTGTGLAGGGQSGDVTISLADSYKLPQTCQSGQITKWNSTNSSWDCANETTNTYTAGEGLNLSNNQFSLADQGVTTAKIADGAVTSEKMTPTILMNTAEGYISTTSNSLVDVPNTSVNLTVPAGKTFNSIVTISGIGSMNGVYDYYLLTINRDNTDLYTWGVGTNGYDVATPFSFTIKDTGLTAGSHTYKIRVANISTNETTTIQKTYIVVQAFATQ